MNYILNIKFKKFNTFKLLKIISYIMNNIVFNLLELIRKYHEDLHHLQHLLCTHLQGK